MLDAGGEPASNNRPYKEDLAFDVWGNMTSRTGRHWSRGLTPFSGNYVNNRMDGWQYDADGRNTVSNSVTSTFDAAGQLIQTSGPQRRNNPPLVLSQGFDGDGQRVRKTEYGDTSYLLRSTVLGGAVVTEIYGSAYQFGQKQRGHVYANGNEIALQAPVLGEAIYTPVDPSGVEGVGAGGAQLDPLGDDVGDEDPYLPDPDPGFSYPHSGDMSDQGSGCVGDGIPLPCSRRLGKSWVRRLLGGLLSHLDRWRSRTDFPNTAGTFPTGQSPITRDQVLSDIFSGTPIGGIFFPRSQDIAKWVTPIFEPGTFAPGTSATPIDPAIIKQAIGDCISAMFPHYALDDFKAISKPVKSKGASDNRFNGSTRIRDVQSGAIGNIVSDPTLSRAELAEVRHHGRGFTHTGNPWWGWVAPDLDQLNIAANSQLRYPNLFGAMPFLKTQLHELGGSLGLLTFKNYPGDYRLYNNDLEPAHDDNGPAFEDCVGRHVYQALGLTSGK